MSDVTVYGAAYSTYTRSALIALHEKSATWTLVEVDIFQPVPPEHVARQPWGKIPVLEHNGFQVYETAAVTRYIDETFPGIALQPDTARNRARMMQAISVLDSYGYKPAISDLFVQRAAMPKFGQPSDEAVIAAALPKAVQALDAIGTIQGVDPFVAGTFSLADIHLAPIVAYVRMTPEGDAMLRDRPTLAAWWERIAQRPSITATRSPLEG